MLNLGNLSWAFATARIEAPALLAAIQAEAREQHLRQAADERSPSDQFTAEGPYKFRLFDGDSWRDNPTLLPAKT